MKKTEAIRIVGDITELEGLELYDILEDRWVIFVKAELINIESQPGYFQISIDLEPLEGAGPRNISFDYFTKNIKMNKPHFNNTPVI